MTADTKRVEKTHARISAKRLLPEARAAGYSGSARNFRRLVAKAKGDWRAGHHRGRRPGVWSPGETLITDWGAEGPLHVFCAVLAWSRFRFVRFATDETAATTLSLLAECFEVLGGVPKVVLADRMGCLKAGVVMNVVVPTATYVRFATHYGFRPDFCEAADPESKGMVEHLVGYAKRDLVIPAECSVADLPGANVVAAAWCCEVNGAVHSEICAVPAERLGAEAELLRPLPSLRPAIGKVTTRKVDKLCCIRFGSARYSVPLSLVGRTVEVHVSSGRLRVVHLGSTMAEHELVAPGETSICDDHYGGPRNVARRAPRPRSDTERAVLALGQAAEAFVKGAAAAGASTLGAELPELLRLEAAHGPCKSHRPGLPCCGPLKDQTGRPRPMRRVPPSVLVREDLNRLLVDGVGEGSNIISDLVEIVTRLVVQQLLEGEQADFLGGRGRYERRSGDQRGSRNGYEPGRIRTAEEAIDLAVPQVRGAGETYRSNLMSFLEGNSDVLEGLVTEMYARGLSTRDVEDAFKDATGELLISKSAVSEITDQLWEDYQAFIARDLSEISVEYFFCDAIFESLRRQGAKEALLVAWCIDSDGRKPAAPGSRQQGVRGGLDELLSGHGPSGFGCRRPSPPTAPRG